MVDVSIICLIYKSPKLADFFYESLIKYTPLLKNGKVEFFFVANDPTKELVRHLKKKKYPFIINNNEIISDNELFNKGYSKPEYIRRVYMGYNAGIKHAKGDKVVLLNSDNFFSKDWLENLLKYLSYDSIICSTLVEPGHNIFGVFPQAKYADFGNTIEGFCDNDFQTYANFIKKTGLKTNGAYMPCLMYKDIAIMAGLYPEGNIAGKNVNETKFFGDMYFYQKLSAFNIKQYTSKDSIVYHLKEGEKDITASSKMPLNRKTSFKYDYTMLPQFKYLVTDLKPTDCHNDIIKKLLLQVSIFIYDYNSIEELDYQIKTMLNQTYDSKEIIVVKNNHVNIDKFINEKYLDEVNVVDFDSDDYVYRIILSICKSDGSYIFLSSPKYDYSNETIQKLFNLINKDNRLNDVVMCEVSEKENANSMLIPKDLVIINIPSLLNCILGDEFDSLNLDNFNGDYHIVKTNENLVKLREFKNN